MGYFTDHEGYVRITDGLSIARLHQLLLIADGADPEEVFADSNVIHHKNNVKWDNRVENLEMMTNSEHASRHASQRDYEDYYDHSQKDWWDEGLLRELYHDNGMTQQEIADTLGTAQATIKDRFEDFDISTRDTGKRRVEIPVSRMEEWVSDNSVTQKDLANEFDTTTATVRKRLREHGF